MEKPPMIAEEAKIDLFLTITHRRVKELTLIGSIEQFDGAGDGIALVSPLLINRFRLLFVAEEAWVYLRT
jgi:hypothetical protein